MTDQQRANIYDKLEPVLTTEEIADIWRVHMFVDFVIERLDELGIPCPDDQPLHTTLDEVLTTYTLMVREYNTKGQPVPCPETQEFHPKTPVASP